MIVAKFFKALWLVVRYGPERILEWGYIDPLTGVLNRRALEERGSQEIWRAERYGRPLTAIMIDLNNFKKVNDVQGHNKGDEILRMVSLELRNSFRRSDIVFRYGGDEFLLLLPETNEEEARAIVLRVGHLPISFGIASWEKGFSLEGLIHEADKRMYDRKEKNKNGK